MSSFGLWRVCAAVRPSSVGKSDHGASRCPRVSLFVRLLRARRVWGRKKCVCSPHTHARRFALDLAEMIDARFLQKGRSLKATRAHWAMVCVALMLAASAWCGWSEGSASACLVLPLAQWLLAALTTHEALHGSLSSDARVNFCCQFFALPVMYNPLTWMPEHLLSHHQHTNDAQLDVDLHQWAPVRLSAQQRAVPARGEEGRGAFLGTTGFPQFVLKSALSTVGQAVLQPMRALTDAPTPNFDRNITPAPKCVPKWAIALSLLPPALVAAWHPSLWLLGLASGDSHVDLETLARGLFLELWPWVATSLIWSTMTQVSHIQQACQTNGDQRDDFWKAQVETALDYSVTCAAATPLTAGLNMQGLHHALPNVCQCHFPEIYPEYLQICKKHDVTPNHSENIFTAAASLLTFVADVNRDPEPATTNEAPLQAVATL